MICVKNDRWFVLKWQIYIISVSHQNQNNGLPCCSTPRRISFLCFVLIQTSLHEGDAWYHFVVIFTCLLLTLYFICNSMAINLIWIELNWILSIRVSYCDVTAREHINQEVNSHKALTKYFLGTSEGQVAALLVARKHTITWVIKAAEVS